MPAGRGISILERDFTQHCWLDHLVGETELSQKVSDEQDQIDSDCLDVGIVAPSLNFNLTEDHEDGQKRVTEWISLSLFSVWPH